MTDDTTTLDLDALLAHQGFLRRLATQLVGDVHVAEDLVQDSFTAALEREPAERDGLRAWLARVVRNRAANVRQRGRTRAEEELDVARTTKGEERVEEKLELQRSVAEAVRGLPDPQRTCVYLRYFEELGPRAIATRIDAPLDTVKSRLKRGLELLRARLDDDYGTRDSWCVLLLPFCTPELGAAREPSPAPQGLRALASSPLVIVAAVGGLALGSWWLRAPAVHAGEQGRDASLARQEAPTSGPAQSLRAPAAEGTATRSAGQPASAPASLAVAGQAERGAEQQEESKAGGPTARRLSGPAHRQATYRIEGSLIHATGGPVAGARIWYREPVATSDAAGRFAFETDLWLFDGGTRIGRTWTPLIATLPGHQPVVVEAFTATIDPNDERTQRVELVLPGPELAVRGRVFEPGGRPAAGWHVSLLDPVPGIGAPERESDKRSVEELAFGRELIVTTDAQGGFRIGGLLERDYELIAWHPSTLLHVRAGGVRAGSSGLSLHAPEVDAPRTISGRVTSLSGTALAGVEVRAALLVSDDWPDFSGGRHARAPAVTSAADGSFRLEGHPAQPLVLEFVAPELLMMPSERIALAPDDPWQERDFALARRCAVRIAVNAQAPPAQLACFLDERDERLWLHLAPSDPMHAALPWCYAIPTEGRTELELFVSEAARALAWRNWDGEELARVPLALDPARVNTIE